MFIQLQEFTKHQLSPKHFTRHDLSIHGFLRLIKLLLLKVTSVNRSKKKKIWTPSFACNSYNLSLGFYHYKMVKIISLNI